MAASSHRRLAGPGGRSTSTRATAVAAPATACPEGKENPTTSTSGKGGRPRWKNVLALLRISSAAAPGITQVARARHRFRIRSHAVTAIRRGIVTRPLPRTLRKRARSVSPSLRMSSIQWNTERSNSPTNGSVVVGAIPGGCRPTAAKTNTIAPSRTTDQPIARRWFESTLVAAHAGGRARPAQRQPESLLDLTDQHGSKAERHRLVGLEGEGRLGAGTEPIAIG